MNSKKTKISDTHGLMLNLEDNMYPWRGDKRGISNLSIVNNQYQQPVTKYLTKKSYLLRNISFRVFIYWSMLVDQNYVPLELEDRINSNCVINPIQEGKEGGVGPAITVFSL